MLLEVATHPVIAADAEPPHPVTPYSLTLVLAYLHYYTPERLPNGRLIAPKHLRLLADWIGYPAPSLRSLRQHLPLAAHMALLLRRLPRCNGGFLANSSLCPPYFQNFLRSFSEVFDLTSHPGQCSERYATLIS
jgi:hypothetical protein